MSEKTEALRLADLWEKHSHGYARTPEARTAAELRRLSAVEAQRDALLEALRGLLSYAFTLEMRLLDADGEHRAMQQARAAIKAVEENT